jgi:hypothetical protein
MCLVKSKGFKKVKVKIVSSSFVPRKGQRIQVVAMFPRRKLAEQVRELWTDEFLKGQWGTQFFIHGRDEYPEHMKR